MYNFNPMAFWQKIFTQKKRAVQEEDGSVSSREKEKEIDSGGLQKLQNHAESSRATPGILLYSRSTEKSSRAGKERKYVFAVSDRADKREVKHAVDARFGVHTESVRMLRLPGKKHKRGRQVGWRPEMKKAIVTVREGENIEIT